LLLTHDWPVDQADLTLLSSRIAVPLCDVLFYSSVASVLTPEDRETALDDCDASEEPSDETGTGLFKAPANETMLAGQAEAANGCIS
jgi:hypothetical protein